MGLLFTSSVFLIIGISFLVITSKFKKHNKELYSRCTCYTEGVAYNIDDEGQNTDSAVQEYYPVYEYIVDTIPYYYKDLAGNYNTNKADVSKCIIHYNPENPEEAYIDNSADKTIIKLFTLLGIIFLLIGIILGILQFII